VYHYCTRCTELEIENKKEMIGNRDKFVVKMSFMSQPVQQKCSQIIAITVVNK